MTVEPASTRANRINSDSFDWSYIGISFAVGRSASELRKAAVNGDLAAGHEAAVLRREKGGHGPDLRRIGHALKRSHRGEDLHALLAQRFLREFGRRRPGRQHVYPDTGALQVLRPGPRE